MSSEFEVKTVGTINYEADNNRLKTENEALMRKIAECTANYERALKALEELEIVCDKLKNQEEFLKGQIEAYQYCIERRCR